MVSSVNKLLCPLSLELAPRTRSSLKYNLFVLPGSSFQLNEFSDPVHYIH